MSFFALKLLAVLSMLFDHFYALFGQQWIILPLSLFADTHPWFIPLLTLAQRLLPFFGRLAAPIFLFCIANGYRHTRSVSRYALRIFGFALAAQIPYALYFHACYGQPVFDSELNFMFTLLLGLLALWCVDRVVLHPPLARRSWACRGAGLAGAAGLIALASLLNAEGGWAYALLVILFFLTLELPVGQRAVLWFFVFPLCRFRLFALLADTPDFGRWLYIILINAFGPYLGVLATLAYNGEKGRAGKAMQYFVYAFYPLHFLVLYLLWLVA